MPRKTRGSEKAAQIASKIHSSPSPASSPHQAASPPSNPFKSLPPLPKMGRNFTGLVNPLLLLLATLVALSQWKECSAVNTLISSALPGAGVAPSSNQSKTILAGGINGGGTSFKTSVSMKAAQSTGADLGLAVDNIGGGRVEPFVAQPSNNPSAMASAGNRQENGHGKEDKHQAKGGIFGDKEAGQLLAETLNTPVHKQMSARRAAFRAARHVDANGKASKAMGESAKKPFERQFLAAKYGMEGGIPLKTATESDKELLEEVFAMQETLPSANRALNSVNVLDYALVLDVYKNMRKYEEKEALEKGASKKLNEHAKDILSVDIDEQTDEKAEKNQIFVKALNLSNKVERAQNAVKALENVDKIENSVKLEMKKEVLQTSQWLNNLKTLQKGTNHLREEQDQQPSVDNKDTGTAPYHHRGVAAPHKATGTGNKQASGGGGR